MRVFYVVEEHTYELEPVWTTDKQGHIKVSGAGLYTPEGEYKGWWEWKTWPATVRTLVLGQVKAYVKRELASERLERVRIRSTISKTK